MDTYTGNTSLKLLFRSSSMREGGHQPQSKMKKRISCFQRSLRQPFSGETDIRVSLSLDDMLTETSENDMLEEFPPPSNEFRRTEGMHSLINEDNDAWFLGRVRSFSCNDQHLLITVPDQKEHNSFCNFKSKKSPFGLEPPEPNADITDCNRAPEETLKECLPPNTFDSLIAKRSQHSKPDVQMSRCLALYERKRNPHYCCNHQHNVMNLRPSSWVYGNAVPTIEKQKLGKTTIIQNGSKLKLDRSMSNSVSCDSFDSGSKNSRKLSMPSESSSSDFEFDLSSNTTTVKHTDVDRTTSLITSPGALTQGCPKSILSKSNEGLNKDLEKGKKSSSIPRPIISQSFTETSRPASLTLNGTTVKTMTEKSVNRKRQTPRERKGVTRSVSMIEKHGSSLSKSAPSTPSSLSMELNKSMAVGLSQGSSSESSLSSIESLAAITTAERTNRTCVEKDQDGYPAPQPSTCTKSDIFNPSEYTEVDQKALQTAAELANSFEDLMNYLQADIVNDLSIVRAIYRWVVAQRLPLTVKTGEINQDSPFGFLYNIRQGRATYSELFAVLCRRAGIPCVIINGVAKGVMYDVGDKVTHGTMKNTWNAVYVQNEWRFVHPNWARHSVHGYSSGRWAVVECDSFHNDNDDSRQPITDTVNDFFFLTDPDKFITKCFPDDPCWQLLRIPLTISEFENLPFLQPAFYELQLELKSHNNSCVIHAESGQVMVSISLPADGAKIYKFKYTLFMQRDCAAEGEYEELLLDRYLLHYTQEQEARFEIRIPVCGVYKLELHCTDDTRQLPSDWICDFKIICSEPMPECEPLPVIPSIGWGPGLDMENCEIECLTHKHAIVNIDSELVTSFRFALPKDKELFFEAELLKNDESRTKLNSHVVLEQNGELAVVQVSPPSVGEYALQIYVKDESSGTRRNICNFLMRRTCIVEEPDLSDIRKELMNATKLGYADTISHWLERFEERGMEDRGDASAAKKKLYLEKISRDLKEAMSKKDLDLLERTMHSISGTSIKRQLGKLAMDADAALSRLRRLKRLRHAVLEMDQKTISEIRSYPKPPTAVHAVMAATFLLLGNREIELKKWSKIQGLISKHGKDSLKRRVADFHADNVSSELLARVVTILDRYDTETIQIASSGAATFYQWASTTSGEIGADREKT